ncbi:MAG: hypothetical protein GY821_16370 [Gammaproteobacteria bacterium]|nr:hypothetical protein [Gammaproteobacteria bacterium]
MPYAIIIKRVRRDVYKKGAISVYNRKDLAYQYLYRRLSNYSQGAVSLLFYFSRHYQGKIAKILKASKNLEDGQDKCQYILKELAKIKRSNKGSLTGYDLFLMPYV